MLSSSCPQPVALSTLLCGFTENKIQEEILVHGITMDSRYVQAGDLFLACIGGHSIGHSFIAEAIEKGAAAIAYDKAVPANVSSDRIAIIPITNLSNIAGLIAERFYGNPTDDLLVIGVTGTNGKTSCTHFIAQVLNEGFGPCGIVGTLGAGLYGELTAGLHTTPDVVTLHHALADMRNAGAKYVAMETSSHGLEQGRVSGVKFDIAMFTNLTRDHLDYHGNMAAYGAAKLRLFIRPELKFAVINVDDEFGRKIINELGATVTPIAYGLNETANFTSKIATVSGKILSQDQNGIRIHVSTPWGDGVLASPLIGEFNASNLLASLSVLIVAGLTFEQALYGLSRARAVPGRMETFIHGESFPTVVVDYAHTPDALKAILTAVRKHCHGLLWCVFGCGGDRDRGKRPLMGKVAQQFADRLVITDDNPRTENPQQIVSDICAGITGEYQVIQNRAEAIVRTIKHANHSDVVVVAGKGHEDYQEIGHARIPYSDRETVLRVLRGALS